MYISGINGYLSKYEGTEVDAAVERVQGLDAELALKVDKTTTVNGMALDRDIFITAESIGAMPLTTNYGRSVRFADNVLYLQDQYDRALSNTYVEIDAATWGKVAGNLSEQTDLYDALNSKQPMITPEAMVSSDLIDDTSAAHKFATAAQLTQIATNTANIATNAGNIALNANSINIINGKIPAQASTSNQLADKNFVNSSIATNTANFIGTFNSVEDLEAYSGTLTNNDYAFVQTTDSVGNTLYDRYKYNGTEWLFEYELNNSSFTANQWAAINSGITDTGVGQITTNQNDITTINNTLDTYGNIVTHNVSEFATAAQGAKADTALQSIDSAMVVAALGYTPYDDTNPDGFISGITSSDVTTALGYTPYDSTNPDGFISGITSSDVTTALGYTPYDSTNPDGFISSASMAVLTDVDLTNVADGEYLKYDSAEGKWVNTALTITSALEELTDVDINNPTQGQNLVYDSVNEKWINASTSATVGWGGITGTLSDQTDLQAALDDKQDEIIGAASTITENDLTVGRVLVSDSNGKVSAGTITTTKLGYLSDVTSNIQVQLNDKLSSASIDTLTDVTLTNLRDGEVLKYDDATNKWVNSLSAAGEAIWGDIVGTLSDQTDLQDALDAKASVTFRDWSAS